MNPIAFVVFSAIAISMVSAFSGGAPEGVCDDMTPKHPSEPQTSKSPFNIILNKKSVSPGGTVKCVITAPAGLKFKGFFVQARVGNVPVGKFSVNKDVNKVINCAGGKQNAATHINADNKSRVTLTWTAPADLNEDVVFWVTVAKNGGEYWVAQKSEKIAVV